MNRQQRRQQEKIDRKQRRAMWPSGYCEVPKELTHTLPDGERFTIAGLRRNADGTFNLACKPGEETEFVSKVTG
jgi:hypothetical protein